MLNTVVKSKLLRLIVVFVFSHMAFAAPSTSEWVRAGVTTSSSLALSFGLRFVPTKQCYWCRVNDFDLAIARAWQAKDLATARAVSNIIAFGVVPLMSLASVFLVSETDDRIEDALVIISTAAATSAITELVKVSARRIRPEAKFGYSSGCEQDHRSFLSGHTSFSFSVLTSTSMMAFKRGSRYAAFIASLSSIVGTAAGLSRVAAAKHWASDVLAGMTLGIGIGATMPFIILDDVDKLSGLYVVPDPAINGLELGVHF